MRTALAFAVLLAGCVGQDIETDAEIEADEAIDALARRHDLTERHVLIAIVWGYLQPHPDATESVDWSGGITVENAGLDVVRVLTLEVDPVAIRPRTDIATVDFESHTTRYADGLVLEVVLAPELNPDHEPITLSFDSPVYRNRLTIERDMRRRQVDEVDEAGHKVAYRIFFRPRHDDDDR